MARVVAMPFCFKGRRGRRHPCGFAITVPLALPVTVDSQLGPRGCDCWPAPLVNCFKRCRDRYGPRCCRCHGTGRCCREYDPATHKWSEKLNTYLEPDAAVPIDGYVMTGLRLLCTHFVPYRPQHRYDAREFDAAWRHDATGHFELLELNGGRRHGLSLLRLWAHFFCECNCWLAMPEHVNLGSCGVLWRNKKADDTCKIHGNTSGCPIPLFQTPSSTRRVLTCFVTPVTHAYSRRTTSRLRGFHWRSFSISEEFLSFLTDYATLSRFLIVIPVLILGEQPIHARYALVAHHFEKFLIADNEKSSFESKWRSHENLMGSTLVRVILLLLTFALAGWLSDFLVRREMSSWMWWRGSGGFRSRRPAPGPYLSASNSRLPHVSLDLEANRLGTIPAIDDATEPSSYCSPPGPPRRVGVPGGFVAGATSFQLLPGRWFGRRNSEPGVSRRT